MTTWKWIALFSAAGFVGGIAFYEPYTRFGFHWQL